MVNTIRNTVDEKVCELANTSLDWIIRNIEFFDVRNQVSDDFRWKLKTYVELVFLTNYLLRSKLYEQDQRLQKIIQFNLDICQSFDVEAMIYHDPDGLAGLAIVEEFLQLTDETKLSFAFTLAKFWAYQVTDILKKIPFRLMDLKYSLERAGIANDLPSYRELYNRTVLGKKAAPPYMSTMDIYSITHTVFYLTDMGHARNLIVDTKELQAIFQTLLKLLAISISERNLDLMGELLMCLSFLEPHVEQEAAPHLTELAWNLIYTGRLPEGAIPSVTFHAPQLSGLSQKEQEKHIFTHCYHPTLVIAGATTAWMK
ncbi:DUF6895 family protein [Caldalkalibacillus mannanilyticus]|uniref:DUF6895 family protein n=1 Tax=Caldalkalibacillus mannanilyticus TaxID=1418 RepID=UPI000469BB58|nr:hypothetical protein [Caldalkalibacillus mannanilyticus]